jgi:hypothetical protein
LRPDAVGQTQKLRQPLTFGPAVLGDRNKIVGTANDSTDGDDDNINQRIRHLTTARIGQFSEAGP